MEQNKVRTYLFYAVGEIMLVVIGILIALQVNNWNEHRVERAKEFIYIERLLAEVERDNSNLQFSINLTNYKIDQSKNLLKELRQTADISDSSEFVRNAFLVGRGGSFRPYLPVYQELLATGDLNIIQNKDITERISGYLNRLQTMESFVYEQGETRRARYMEHLHYYFSAIIMAEIW